MTTTTDKAQDPSARASPKAVILWFIILVVLAVAVIMGSIGYIRTGNPISVLTMPINQSDAISRLQAPTSHHWESLGQRDEGGALSGESSSTQTWASGPQAVTEEDLRQMFREAGYTTAACSHVDRLYCEGSAPTITGTYTIYISYSENSRPEDIHPPMVEAISRTGFFSGLYPTP